MITNQAYLFLIFIINGIIIGLLFDFFRILRKTFKTKDIITYIQDIIFWILTGFVILYSTFTFNNGEIRIFMFIAIFLGILFYLTLISTYIIKVNVKFINLIKVFISKIFRKKLLQPIKLIKTKKDEICHNLKEKKQNITKKYKKIKI